MNTTFLLIVFLPLLGALISGVFGTKLLRGTQERTAHDEHHHGAHGPAWPQLLPTALLLIFVDCVKELPATLLLRPFNFDTLSTHIYGQASLENFSAAAPAALLIVTLSLGAIFLLAKAHR